jgi:hypothetical protein
MNPLVGVFIMQGEIFELLANQINTIKIRSTQMPTDAQEDDTIKVRIPATLTLRDIITFVALAVSVTLAWGVFGTRLTVVESQLVVITKSSDEMKSDIKDSNNRLTQLELRVRENEIMTQDLWNRVRENK